MEKKLFLFLFVLLLSGYAKSNNSFVLTTEHGTFQSLPIQITVDKDYSFNLFSFAKEKKMITGISIDGNFTRTDKQYLVRILLKDVEGHEYLIMEAYREINDKWTDAFSNYCEETKRLNNIIPDSIKIIVRGASLQLNHIHYLDCQADDSRIKSESQVHNRELRMEQVECIAKRINTYNIIHKKLWKAGVTELSLKSYEDKKRILGFNDVECTGGVEYYADGIFEIGEIEDAVTTGSRTSSLSFVDNFDWRNIQGKNWMTSNKHQGDSGFCSAFTAVGTVESLTRLYYNRLDDIDLSEQEAACCNGTNNPWYGMAVGAPLAYIRDYGVCDEIAYPFVNDMLESLNCRSSSITPNELISIGGYASVPKNEDSIKVALINHGPLASSIFYWGYNSDQSHFYISHAMPIVGYGKLCEGDTIYHWIESDGFGNGAYTVEPGDPRIGMTYWIYKSSYGTSGINGYHRYIHYNYHYSVGSTYYCFPSITSMNYTDLDIVCEDSDGDGYYFWGIGTKPAWCPEWVPDTKDGNDSNCLEGKMYYESPNIIGSLEPLTPNNTPILQISNNIIYNTRRAIYTHIIIKSNATLTVNDILNLFGRVIITIESGGELIIDGGVITNAAINFSVGGKLSIRNGGKLILRTNTDFEVPIGAVADIENGSICKSNDF